MDLNLRGKVAVITGGNSGFGKAIAAEFAEEGCRIAICGTKPEKTEAVRREFAAAGYDVYAQVVNVANCEEVQNFADNAAARFGQIDIWVNNAGIIINSPILEVDPEDWMKVINVNLSSVMWGIKAAGNHMKERGGVILNSSSFSGRITISTRASYAASKGGMNSLTKLAAGALAPYNIRVNAVAAGSVMTDIQAGRAPEELEAIVSQISMRRMGTLKEIAQVYVFLASDAAGYITGEIVEVTGGKMLLQDTAKPWQAKNGI
ncbi:MAG: SDR family oxidoreductase [Gracilibacteraceae bacterium]|jgi:NAD(P)-dependent dehydrogenase (short-subunit alcohol dehydrogenase family)|nr:SDR family oxidoreductase [Gracilibacteraceae bacterium]